MTSGTEAENPWPKLPLPGDFDLDLFLVETDLRQLCKWEGVRDDAVDAHLARLEGTGLAHRIVPGPSAGVSVLFLSRSEEVLDRAEALERAYRVTRSFEARAPSSRELGALLGYSACCVEVWATGPQHDEGALLRLEGRLDRPTRALMNFFPRHVAPVGFVPCDVRCENAERRAERVADAMASRHGFTRDELESELRGVVLWLSGQVFLLFRGVSELSAAGFSFESIVTPVESPLFPDIPELRDEVACARALASNFRAFGDVAIVNGAVQLRDDAALAARLHAGDALAQRFFAFTE